MLRKLHTDFICFAPLLWKKTKLDVLKLALLEVDGASDSDQISTTSQVATRWFPPAARCNRAHHSPAKQFSNKGFKEVKKKPILGEWQPWEWEEKVEELGDSSLMVSLQR